MQDDNLYYYALLRQSRLLDEAAARRLQRMARGEQGALRRVLARLLRSGRERTAAAVPSAVEAPLPSAAPPTH